MTQTAKPSPYVDRVRAISAAIESAETAAREADTQATQFREQAQAGRQERLALIAEMRNDNLTWKQVGAELGITESAASHLGRKHGIA